MPAHQPVAHTHLQDPGAFLHGLDRQTILLMIVLRPESGRWRRPTGFAMCRSGLADVVA